MNKKNFSTPRMRKRRHFKWSILVITFIVLAILSTIQMKIVGQFISYEQVTHGHIIITVLYWLFAAVIFTLITCYQINHRYEKPMRRFAKATKQVANGDFSVYVKPMHTTEKMDYLDVMFLDFNKMVEELGSIEILKTDFFSSVSHEIKTPLAVIESYAEALQNDELTKEQRKEYTDTILNSSKRLSELITNILKLSKLENQKISPIAEPYDVCRQLCDSALNFENLWEKKNINFIADIEDIAILEADEGLLELVWNNLLSNAIKFTEAGGNVTLKQTSSQTEIIVSVSDSGCGMSEETLKHIFDKFYQGDSSHSTEGNGLGLSLALRVIQLSGGSIHCKSKQGEGSEFTVHIPISKRTEEDNPNE